MAADKRGYLRDAQKQVQKGQLERAIASYRAVLKIDPNDVKAHNTLGDLYIRRNQKKDGIKEYLLVADYYEKDGFYLRSIAICQKILNLDANLVEVRLKLANLYSLQNLAAEAKKQYLQVADFHERKGNVAEALEIYGKIADLDPSNFNVRVKLGKMYEKQDLPHKAAKEYTRAAKGYLRKKEPDRAVELLRAALGLNPESPSARRTLAEYHLGRQEWPDVIENLAPLVSGESVDIEVLKMYAGACLETGQADESVEALEEARHREPSSKGLRVLLGKAYLQGDAFDRAFELYNPTISAYLKDNKTEAAEELARQLVEAKADSDRAQQRLLDVVLQKGDQEEALQIYRSLAGIYETRGLPRNAVGALEKYLELKPDDREAADKILELKGGTADPAATESAPATVEEGREDVTVDLEGEEPPGAAAGEGAEVLEDEVPAPVETAVGEAAALEETVSEDDEEFVIEPEDVEAPLAEGPEETSAPVETPRPPEAAREEEPPPAALPEETDAVVFEGPPRDDTGEAAAGSDLLDEVDLEEVGLEAVDLDEAELFAGEAAASPVEEGPEAVPEPASSPEDLDLALDALQSAAEQESPLPVEPAATAVAGASEEMEEFLAEADFYMQQGLFDEAGFLYRKLAKVDPENSEIAARLQRLEKEESQVTGTAAAPSPETSEGSPLDARDEILALENDLDRVFGEEKTSSAGLKVSVADGSGGKGGEFTGFLSELRDELDSTGVSTPAPAAGDEESLGEIFQEFQEDLKEQLGEEDFETHYNLGIAYREMGLMEEALGEFAVSEKSFSRKLDSISMIALCLGEMGREEEAVTRLEEGLELAGEGSGEQKGFLYDLGDFYGRLGRSEESLKMFSRLYALDRSYRDVSSRAQPQQMGSRDPEGPPEERREPPPSSKSRVSYL